MKKDFESKEKLIYNIHLFNNNQRGFLGIFELLPIHLQEY